MDSLYSELLMGHNVGLKGRYTKLSPEELLEGNDKNLGYSSVMEFLTINDENRLRRQVQNQNIHESKLEKEMKELAAQIIELNKKVGDMEDPSDLTKDIELYKRFSTDESIRTIKEGIQQREKEQKELEEQERKRGWRWDNDKQCHVDIKTDEIIKKQSEHEIGKIVEKAPTPDTRDPIHIAMSFCATEALKSGKKVNCSSCGTPYDYKPDLHFVSGKSFLVECGKCYNKNKNKNKSL